MKRSLFIILILFNLLAAAYGVSMKKVLIPEGIVGSAYFPIFVGEKWTWSVSSGEKVRIATWYIGATYIVNDDSLGLKNCVAYEVTEVEANRRWFLIEHEGYISRYESAGKSYRLTRLVPVVPTLKDSWSGGGAVSKIVSLDDILLKVESGSKGEYSIYKRGVGPFEFVESGARYRLREYIAFNKVKTLIPLLEDEPAIDYNAYKKELAVKIDEDVEDEPVEDEPVDTLLASKADELKGLSARYNYVQVGAFSLKVNALKYMASINDRGYRVRLYRDNDNRYKVLLENDDKRGDNFLVAVRKELTKDAFMKQRRTEF